MDQLTTTPPVGTKMLYRDDNDKVIEGEILEQTYTGKAQPGIVPKDFFVIKLYQPDCHNQKKILLPKRCFGDNIQKDKSTLNNNL